MGWLLHIEIDSAEVEVTSSRLWDLGTTGVAELPEATLVAGFETEGEAVAARSALGQGIVSAYDPGVVTAPEPSCVTRGDHTVELQDNGAFGHGAHPTTQLALDAVARSVVSGTTVLDMGCGTGVLAIAAALFGGATVAVDNDPAALAATRTNSLANSVRLEVADTIPAGQFDFVVANMLLADLRGVAQGIADSVKPGGKLATTGFLHEQYAEVRLLFGGLTEQVRFTLGEWTLVEYFKEHGNRSDR